MDRLENPVRRYAWGSADDIPAFLGVPPDGTPQAELWMGAHPGGPSVALRDGTRRSLLELIARDPDGELGPAVARRFGGRLPFLLKVLAAGAPLSLQVHPDQTRAAARFADPRYADDYTDDNHKPELICALRDGFEVLCGFRPVPATIALLDELAVPALAAWAPALAAQPPAGALRALVTAILTAGSAGGTDSGADAAAGTGTGTAAGTGTGPGTAAGTDTGPGAESLAETIAAVGRAGRRVGGGGGAGPRAVGQPAARGGDGGDGR